jgi:microcystin-dependent protein
LLPINQYQALFSLLGTTYGGNGIQTFALPDLRGRVAIGQGNGSGLTSRLIGETAGEENHTLLSTEMPMHTHSFNAAANATGNSDTPDNTMALANATGTQGGTTIIVNPYAPTPPAPTVPMAPTEIGVAGGGQPHNNMMPYLALQFCISMSGIFPSRG